ncbi:MAG: hypothetical protein ACR2OX_04365 [Methyloligellaceae bacterium]
MYQHSKMGFIMKAVHAIAAVASFILLTGFNEAKREALVANCVKHGTDRQACACSFDVIGKRVGDKYLEIIYLQVSGKITDYEVALLKMVTENPKSMDAVAAAGEEAKRRCSK